jgi:hypothetical protein
VSCQSTVAKRWLRQFDADCHAAFAAVVTSGVSLRMYCVCLNSARLKTSCMHNTPPPDTPDPVGAAGGYDSGEAVVQAGRCGLTRRLRCRRGLRRLPQDLLRLPEQRPTQNILHAQRPTSRHPGPGGSCCELEVTTVAKRWVRQFDADCHAAFAAVVTSGVSHRMCCVCMNSARLKSSCMHSARPPDTPDPVGAAGGYNSGEAVGQAIRC